MPSHTDDKFMKFQKKQFTVRDITITGVLGALMLAISYTESAVTSLLPLPPGIKPGLANIVVMFACSVMGFWYALCLTLIKSAFALLLSGATAGFISLSGGILSVAATALLIGFAGKKLSYIGISVLGALCHNIGQTAAACIIIGSLYYLAYLPVLIISAVVTGCVTGTAMKIIMPQLKRLKMFEK